MSTKKIPKFSKRLNFSKTSTPNHEPTTFEEFHQAALEDEESGDRFRLSDLFKSLRFYDSAYQKYLKAQSLNSMDIENLYNLHCLIFNVWELFKNGNFSILELSESLNGTIVDVLKFEIEDIKQMYDFNVFKLLNEYSGNKFGKVSDFCFNLIVVNLEVLEKDGPGQVDILNDCLRLFELIFSFQSPEVERFLDDLRRGNVDDISLSKHPSFNSSGTEVGEKLEYETVDQVTPDTVLDTLTQGYKLISIFLNNSKDSKDLIQERLPMIQEFKNKIDKIISDLLVVCSNGFYTMNQVVLNEIKIQEHLISSTGSNFNYDSILSHWNSFNIDDDNYTWKLALVDNLTVLMEINTEDGNLDKVVIWNKSNELFKDIENTLKLKLKPENSTGITGSLSQSLDISDHLIKLVECLINRSDNELSKFQITNNQVNFTNCANILKTALNYLNSINCGLRETMVNKLIKRRLKRQIWVRLIILEEQAINEEKIKGKIGEKFYNEDLTLLENNAEAYVNIFS